MKSVDQIAEDIVFGAIDNFGMPIGMNHYLIRRIREALEEAETRGLANGTLCTVPASSLPRRAPVEVSEEKLDALCKLYLDSVGAMDLTHNVAHYKAGFREAMRIVREGK